MDCIVRGRRVDFSNPDAVLAGLEQRIAADLAATAEDAPAHIRRTIAALDRLGGRLKAEENFLAAELASVGLSPEEMREARDGAATILDAEALHRKIRRELGGLPLEITRVSAREKALEGWIPLGVLGHVTSANDAMLPFLSAVEGLITGNINVLKTARNAEAVAVSLVEALCEIEPALAPYLHIYPLSSHQEEHLKRLFSLCDAIAVWGSDAAVSGVRRLAPGGVPVVAWGHRISFAYVTRQGGSADTLHGIAHDVCINEQQACSAPQVVYYETESREELLDFADALYDALVDVSPRFPVHDIPDVAQAEITTQVELARCAEIMGDMTVLRAPDFRLLVGYDREPTPSPLFRSVRVKGLPRGAILETLRPYRAYLQTVGLAAAVGEVAELSALFFRAGATRVVTPGAMLDGYVGEPHDGVFALSRYVRRVSLENAALPSGLMDMSELRPVAAPPFPPKTPLLPKAAFSVPRPPAHQGGLVLKSGGSSGKPVYAAHSYGDADMTYITAGRALMAAGFDPATDRCMNLFYSGFLYGGFLSIYEALKSIDAVQYPMAAEADFSAVVDAIIEGEVNVLVGMPSYLVQLFAEQRERLKAYGGVKKIFYGGEHLDPAQAKKLKEDFGVERVASLVYGCNEVGAIGYACPHCRNGEHHLCSTRYMEILKLDSDEPVSGQETGRIVVSALDTENNAVFRFEIGDLGRYVPEPCPCGRTAPKFELLGRFGDVFRFATYYINYGRIKNVLARELCYTGWLQIILEYGDRPTMHICAEESLAGQDVLSVLARQYPDLGEILQSGTGHVRVRSQPREAFIISSAGGKVRNVVERRHA